MQYLWTKEYVLHVCGEEISVSYTYLCMVFIHSVRWVQDLMMSVYKKG